MVKTKREAVPAEKKPKSFAKVAPSVLLTLTLTMLAGGMRDVIANDQAEELEPIPENEGFVSDAKSTGPGEWSRMPPLDYEGFVSMEDAITEQEYEEYRFRDFFIFDKPKGWGMDTGERGFGLSPDEKKIYGITLTASVHYRVPSEISIHFYGEGNLLDDTVEKYIRAHADPVWNDTPDRVSNIIVEEVEISGRKAFKFTGTTPVHIYDSPMKEPKPDNGTMSRRMRPGRTVRVPEQYVVFPSGNAYYALRYRAPRNAEELFQPVFDRIVDSFKPLK